MNTRAPTHTKTLGILAVSTLVGALAALLLPGTHASVSGQASLVLVAAVTVLAGHTWAAPLAAVGMLVLAGQMIPQAASFVQKNSSLESLAVGAALVVLAMALVAARSLPRALSEVRFSLLAGPPTRRRTFLAVVSFLALVLPALG